MNPSSVNYAPTRESAIKKATIRGEVAVTCLVQEWERIFPPASTDGGEGR